jgi:hypothetical protein
MNWKKLCLSEHCSAQAGYLIVVSGSSPKFYDSEDWQFIKTKHSYESLIATHLNPKFAQRLAGLRDFRNHARTPGNGRGLVTIRTDFEEILKNGREPIQFRQQ